MPEIALALTGLRSGPLKGLGLAYALGPYAHRFRTGFAKIPWPWLKKLSTHIYVYIYIHIYLYMLVKERERHFFICVNEDVPPA